MPIYMKYGAVKGDATEEGHKDWIEIGSFQWGVGRAISTPTGGAKNRESSAPSISEITVTKGHDIATVPLVQELYQGHGKDCDIDFVATDKGKLRIYMSIKLTNTMVSGYSFNSGGDRPSESVSLNFTKIEMKTKSHDTANAAGANQAVTYDVGAAKTV